MNSGRIKVKVADISLNATDYEKVKKLMKNWDMTIEEFCKYAVVAIAQTHDSKRALEGPTRPTLPNGE